MKTKKMKRLSLLVLLLTSLHVNSQTRPNTKFGKGIINAVAKDSSWSLLFGVRTQTLFVADWDVNDTSGFGQMSSNFLIRRARFKLGGFVFSPKIKYKMEFGLSNKDLGKADSRTNLAPRMILDAVVKWNFYKNFVLWAGQTKLAGNRERVVSSANLQFVDRSLLNKVYNIDRDVGIQLRHHFKIGSQFIVREIASVSVGEGRNLVQDNLGGYQYTGRIELLPFGKFESKGDYINASIKREQKPKLSVAFTYDYNDRAVKDRSNMGSYLTYDTNGDGEVDGYFESTTSTIFADLMFKYKGISVMAEYALRTSDKEQQSIVNDDLSVTTGTVQVGSGFNAQVGYMFQNNWEVAGRFTQIVPGNILNKNQYEQYTFGISKYIVGHKLKVQTDVSWLTTNNSSNNNLMYRLQFELHL
tara:strand:+ start:33994 stop:35235 length:1242 start_codon:yes stop_codon:yes gene_type:complete